MQIYIDSVLVGISQSVDIIGKSENYIAFFLEIKPWGKHIRYDKKLIHWSKKTQKRSLCSLFNNTPGPVLSSCSIFLKDMTLFISKVPYLKNNKKMEGHIEKTCKSINFKYKLCQHLFQVRWVLYFLLPYPYLHHKEQ